MIFERLTDFIFLFAVSYLISTLCIDCCVFKSLSLLWSVHHRVLPNTDSLPTVQLRIFLLLYLSGLLSSCLTRAGQLQCDVTAVNVDFGVHWTFTSELLSYLLPAVRCTHCNCDPEVEQTRFSLINLCVCFFLHLGSCFYANKAWDWGMCDSRAPFLFKTLIRLLRSWPTCWWPTLQTDGREMKESDAATELQSFALDIICDFGVCVKLRAACPQTMIGDWVRTSIDASP